MNLLVDCDWLAARLGNAGLRILDASVRFEPPGGVASARPEWEASHIPGSVFADHFELANETSPVPLTMPPHEELARRLGHLGVGDGHRVVVYDRSDGMWAARLWWMLHAIGLDDVAVLDGGWRRWVDGGHPVTSGPTPIEPATLTARPRAGAFVSKDDVLAALGRADVAIVSALPVEVHERGDYGRPGLIPSSRVVPYLRLIDPATNTLLPPPAIRELFADELAAPKVITYCGGGVASSLAALALYTAGHAEVAVYDGSLLEWCGDPALPLDPA